MSVWILIRKRGKNTWSENVGGLVIRYIVDKSNSFKRQLKLSINVWKPTNKVLIHYLPDWGSKSCVYGGIVVRTNHYNQVVFWRLLYAKFYCVHMDNQLPCSSVHSAEIYFQGSDIHPRIVPDNEILTGSGRRTSLDSLSHTGCKPYHSYILQLEAIKKIHLSLI